MAKKATFGNLFSAILYIFLGVVLVAFPGSALKWGMLAAGAFFLISGILDLLKKNYAGGIVSIVFGIIILVLGWLVLDIVLLVLGILIAIKGVVAFLGVFKKGANNALELVFPILSVVIGLMLAFGNGLDILIIITGVLLAVDGAIGLVGSLKK